MLVLKQGIEVTVQHVDGEDNYLELAPNRFATRLRISLRNGK